jgi:hypothetical protein
MAEVGEIAAVGELLKFAHWRGVLARLLHSQHSDRAERELDPPSFKGLALLLNCMVDECATDRDFGNARLVLQAAQKLWMREGAAAAADGRRAYLAYALRGRRLWSEVDFWDACVEEEVAAHKQGFAAESPLDYEAFLFATLSRYAYTVLNMGLAVADTAALVRRQCAAQRLARDQEETLLKLIQNIAQSVALDRSSAPQ